MNFGHLLNTSDEYRVSWSSSDENTGKEDFKITKKYSNEIVLMDFEYLDKWIGTANFQKILEALENDKTEKKLFVDIVLDVGSI